MNKKINSSLTFQKEHHSCYFQIEKYIRHNSYQAGTSSGFFSPRLAYIKKGNCKIVEPNGSVLEFGDNSLLFIPKNKPYISYWTASDLIEFYAIEFDFDFSSDKYTAFQVITDLNVLPLFEKLFFSKESDNAVSTLASFYSILETVTPLLKKGTIEESNRILPALNYLTENYFVNVKVKDLARMCSLSESGFYQLFKKVTKLSPIEYKNSVKLSHAVTMIKNGSTLEEICEKLNFTSPAFLRRLMKKRYKKTPREIKNEETSI